MRTGIGSVIIEEDGVRYMLLIYTKEQLGGFYLVEAPDLDAAIGWATRIPGAALGSVEVRPVMELPATFEEYQRSS